MTFQVFCLKRPTDAWPFRLLLVVDYGAAPLEAIVGGGDDAKSSGDVQLPLPVKFLRYGRLHVEFCSRLAPRLRR